MPAGRQRRRVLNGAVAAESRPALAAETNKQADGAAEQRAGSTGVKQVSKQIRHINFIFSACFAECVCLKCP